MGKGLWKLLPGGPEPGGSPHTDACLIHGPQVHGTGCPLIAKQDIGGFPGPCREVEMTHDIPEPKAQDLENKRIMGTVSGEEHRDTLISLREALPSVQQVHGASHDLWA